MITYLITFAVILLVLYSAVHIHMILGLHRSTQKENLDEISRTPSLHEVLFTN